MKRWLIFSGCAFLGVGALYDAMPIELLGAIYQMFSSSSSSVYFRVVPTEHADPLKISLMLIGIGLLVGGLLMRTKPKP